MAKNTFVGKEMVHKKPSTSNNGLLLVRCKRGPVGLPGAPGVEGPRGETGAMGIKGEKGEPGSFDFFMLMMADLRHDLEQLQARVYPNRAMPRYNMQKHLAWEQRMKDKHSSSSLNHE